LTQAPFSPKGLTMSRKVPGPHIAFYVPAINWSSALAHLDSLGISHGDRGAAKERHEGQGGTYMDDPAGYGIQFITDGMDGDNPLLPGKKISCYDCFPSENRRMTDQQKRARPHEIPASPKDDIAPGRPLVRRLGYAPVVTHSRITGRSHAT